MPIESAAGMAAELPEVVAVDRALRAPPPKYPCVTNPCSMRRRHGEHGPGVARSSQEAQSSMWRRTGIAANERRFQTLDQAFTIERLAQKSGRILSD